MPDFQRVRSLELQQLQHLSLTCWHIHVCVDYWTLIRSCGQKCLSEYKKSDTQVFQFCLVTSDPLLRLLSYKGALSEEGLLVYLRVLQTFLSQLPVSPASASCPDSASDSEEEVEEADKQPSAPVSSWGPGPANGLHCTPLLLIWGSDFVSVLSFNYTSSASKGSCYKAFRRRTRLLRGHSALPHVPLFETGGGGSSAPSSTLVYVGYVLMWVFMHGRPRCIVI